jgi:outer membrane protein assembly factor BamB
VRTTATSIDLGELPRGGSEADTAGERRPDPRQRYGGAGAPARHRWPALAVAAGLALTTAGAAGPPPVWATLQFTVPAGGQVVLTDRHLYLIDETDQRQGMSAHRLTDGSTEWTLTHRTTEDWFTVRGDLPFEISATVVSAGESEWFSYTERTTAFDPDTGEPRWTLAGDLIFPGAGVGALTRHRSLPDQSSWRRELTIVDLATGRELWTTPPFVNWSYPLDDPDLVRQLVTLTEDGELTSYDLATGARLATTRTAAERVEERQVQVVGSLVLLQGPARDTLTAYDLATLRRRWTADLPPGGFLVVSACEPVLCVQGGAVPLALDPATGAAAWSADWLPESGVAGDTWVAQPGPPWPTGLLLVEGWVVEAATGEPVLELREWAPLGGNEPILGRPAALLTRYELPAGPGDAGRTWFGRIRSDPVRLEVLGGVDGRLHRCVTSADQLACQRDDELLVWRLRG